MSKSNHGPFEVYYFDINSDFFDKKHALLIDGPFYTIEDAIDSAWSKISKETSCYKVIDLSNDRVVARSENLPRKNDFGLRYSEHALLRAIERGFWRRNGGNFSVFLGRIWQNSFEIDRTRIQQVTDKIRHKEGCTFRYSASFDAVLVCDSSKRVITIYRASESLWIQKMLGLHHDDAA